MYGGEYGFVEISLERVRAKKFDRQSGRTNERAENPAKLTAKKQISSEPGNEDIARHSPAAADGPQEPKQARVRRDACESDDDHLRQLNKVIDRPGSFRLRGQRWRVPDDEEYNWRERAEDRGRNGKAHQHERKRLPKAEIESEQRGEHAVDQGVAQSGREDHERELDDVVAGLDG